MRSGSLLAIAAALSVLSLAVPTIAPGQASAHTPNEFRERRDSALARLPGSILLLRSRAALASAADPAFRQDPAFFYVTGLENTVGAVIALDGAARASWLFLPDSLAGIVGFAASAQPRPSDSLAARLLLNRVVATSQLARFLDRRLSEDPGLTLRVDPGNFVSPDGLASPLDSLLLEDPHDLWRATLQRRWPGTRVSSDSSVIERLRMVKSGSEIAVLRRVGAASVTAFRAAVSAIAPGARQRAVEGAVVAACLRAGGVGPSFWPWVMSGANGVYPQPWKASGDYRSLDRVMMRGELVRVDLGCEVDHYMGDVGRTVPVSGQFDAGQRETWNLLVRAYRAGLAAVRDGARIADVKNASFAEVRRLRDSLTTPLARRAAGVLLDRGGPPAWQLHGIGLTIAERLPDTLRAGMVLDYEPIFSVDGQGFYLEDMLVVTAQGYEILTPGLPYTATEIERAFRRR